MVWADDPYVPVPNAREGELASNERPPSYRFTPREERSGYGESDDHKSGVGRHAAGRAKVLFRAALQRHSMRQKALLAAAAVAAVEYEEGGQGCKHLLLQKNCIGSRGCAQVCTLVRTSETLETLALACTPLGDAGGALLGRALQHARTLKTLSAQECGISSKGMRHLCAGLAHNRSLTALWLYGNQAEDKGAAHLAAALRSCKLEKLGIEKNGIRTLGCQALGIALSSEACTLRWLRLQHNPLGDAGVTALSRALNEHCSLVHLELRDVGVGINGVKELGEAIKRCERLSFLGLEQNNLAPQATERLLQDMQGSRMVRISLDMGHGGSFDRTLTRDDLSKQLTLAFLGLKMNKQDQQQQARGYVGKLGVSTQFGHAG